MMKEDIWFLTVFIGDMLEIFGGGRMKHKACFFQSMEDQVTEYYETII